MRTEFKVGDVVQVVGGNQTTAIRLKGERGIIRYIDSDAWCSIEFIRPINDRDMHTCSGHVQSGNGYVINQTYLKRVSRSKPPGKKTTKTLSKSNIIAMINEALFSTSGTIAAEEIFNKHYTQ